jgi:transposase
MDYMGIDVIESSTESEWVAQCLEDLGHQVIVADPSFAPMYAQRSRKVKTDRRDARAFCEACALGAYRPAHRSSEASRGLRAQVAPLLAARNNAAATSPRRPDTHVLPR